MTEGDRGDGPLSGSRRIYRGCSSTRDGGGCKRKAIDTAKMARKKKQRGRADLIKGLSALEEVKKNGS